MTVHKVNSPLMEMQSGHNGRMALQLNGQVLFWATELKDHSGVWLVFNAEHQTQQQLLPAITSTEIESARRISEVSLTSYWSRYFARQLMDAPKPLLSAGRWLLRPMEKAKSATPYIIKNHVPLKQWRFETPKSAPDINVYWSLFNEDIVNLQNPEKVIFIDRWWGGYKLLPRYSVKPDSGRVKWWRKKCREDTLPPVLVWFISGLASFVILDGHNRMQAALAESIQPQFLVLSEIFEQEVIPEEDVRERVLHSLALQSDKLKKNSNIDAVNKILMNLYNTRNLYASTCSRAVLGNGKVWEYQVKSYLLRHHMESYLTKVFLREK